MEPIPIDPDLDDSARQAIWNAIVKLAEKIEEKFSLHAYLTKDQSRKITSLQEPERCDETWKLIEILSVLTVLSDAEYIVSREVYNLRGRLTSPVHFTEKGEDSFLWTQTRMKESLSGFAGVPDIIVTGTHAPPSRSNALYIIECKCVRQLSSRHIRAEFAKGYDLRITSYFIWSYYDPSHAVIEGAELLGVKVRPVGLGSLAERSEMMNPDRLIEHFATEIRDARDEGEFERVLQRTGSEAANKRALRLR